MLDFFKKLTIYIKNVKNKQEDTCESFYYKNTVLESSIAQLIHSMWCNNNYTEEMYDKECDYNRLLRKENFELKEELAMMHQEHDQDKNIVESSDSNDTNSNSSNDDSGGYVS